MDRALAALCEPDGQGAAPITAERLIRASAATFAASPGAVSDGARADLAAWARAEGIDLGGAPSPEAPAGRGADDVFTALDRGLGYLDAAERW